MKFDTEKSVAVLSRTPLVLEHLLHDLPDEWLRSNEGPDTFSPFDVVGHLLYGEQTDWQVRAQMILEKGTGEAFPAWDRFAMRQVSKGKNIGDLLVAFRAQRDRNLAWLQSMDLSGEKLNEKGIHPDLGVVTLQQLLATWVVHDLTHIAQITRVMAKQYREEIGPWAAYFRILNF